MQTRYTHKLSMNEADFFQNRDVLNGLVSIIVSCASYFKLVLKDTTPRVLKF